jgi:hypothetical protein
VCRAVYKQCTCGSFDAAVGNHLPVLAIFLIVGIVVLAVAVFPVVSVLLMVAVLVVVPKVLARVLPATNETRRPTVCSR